jgi:hypothetical protein
MLDIVEHIKAGDKEYPMAFTHNVMEAIQDKYGSIDAWSKVLQPEPYKDEEGNIIIPEPKIKDIKWTYMQAINEGIDIENEGKAEKRPFVTEKQVGRLLTIMDINTAKKKIMKLAVESVKTETVEENEDKEKNE